MNEEFLIPLNGLSAGKQCFQWHVGKEFFVGFGDSDIIDADVSVEVSVEKSGNYIGVDCSLDGVLTVPCDRCLEDLGIPVSEMVRLSVKFGDEPSDPSVAMMAEDEREVVYLPADEASMDMAQIIYDYSMLAIPLQRVHPEGGCNPAALKYLVADADAEDGRETVRADSENNPFAALKGLFSN